jgi:hypothetical protein
VRKSYRRPGRKDNPSSEYMILNSAERAYFMYGIAAYMVSKRLENQIDLNQLDQLIDKLIYAMPPSVSESVSATSGETRIPLLKRLYTQDTILDDRNQRIVLSSRQKEQIKTDVRTCGLLVDDPSAQGHFRFPYKLFMEFLFAVVVADLYKSNNISEGQQARSIAHVVEINKRDVLLPSLTACSDFFAELLISDELDKIQTDNMQRPTLPETKALFAKKLLLSLIRHSTKIGIIHKMAILYLTFTFGYGIRGILSYFFTAILISLPFVVSSSQSSQRESALGFSLFISVLPIFGYFIFIALFVWIASPDNLKFWVHMCKSQNVPAATMHEILGTKFLVRRNAETFEFWTAENDVSTMIREVSRLR